MKNHHRILSVILTLLMLLGSMSALVVSAETYIYDQNFKFTRSTDNDITICGYVGKDTEISVPKQLIGYNVEYIGEYAFINETSLTKVDLPTTITTLGQGAFYGCTSLSSANLPTLCINLGASLFYGCSSLSSVSLSSVTTAIPRHCFNFCTSLQEIRLPSTVKTIGDYAFANCDSLQSVYISKYTNSISDTAFYNSPHVVIYGYLNSYAHTYAQEHNIAFCDINGEVTTYYVTYYNYDGSVYWMTSVEEGGTALMPSRNPVKPSTDTHYYEFKYWDGNTTNVQKNEELYPVFAEYEILSPATYYVVFLNGDGTFLSAQTVEAGGSATAPDIIPQKADSDGIYYTFESWSSDFSYVTEDMVITPVFTEHTKEYTVNFTDSEGNITDTFTVAHGDTCPSPDVIPQKATDDEYSYTFTGWDKDLSSVTSDMTVNPVYDTISLSPAPTPIIKTSGSLKIEVAGGTSFTISVDDGAARPQGTSYLNTKMPMGTTVTLVASTTNGNEFLGWVNLSGVIVSTSETYTFVTTGNDYAKAMYKTDIDGVNLVIFKNHKAANGNGQILDMQYYAAGDEISFPDDAIQAGYVFIGWSMTEEEIQAELAAGNDVVVTPIFEVRKVYVTITVNGGEVTTNGGQNGAGQYLAYKATTIVADAAADGMRFAYWVDGEGNIISYKTSYLVYPTEDMVLTAVYVAEDEEVTETALIGIAADTTAEGNTITFIVSWYIPESVGTFTAGGILIVQDKFYNPETFVVGTTDSNVQQAAPGAIQSSDIPGYALNKRNVCVPGTTWYACSWVQYVDATTGEDVTLYSDLYSATKY